MEILAKVVAQKPVRSIESKKEAGKTISVVDLVVTTGLDTLLITAFDSVANRLVASPLGGKLAMFNIACNVSGNQEDAYRFQSIRLIDYYVYE